MNKFTKVLRHPRYAINVVASRLKRFIFLKDKVYTHLKEYRSDSENGFYESEILFALKNRKAFAKFKRGISYKNIVSGVSQQQGARFLEILKSRNDEMLEKAVKTVLISDEQGGPNKYNYTGFTTPFNPTTLRYVKISSDLKILFGMDLGNIAEIGCGYGGQTLANDQLLNVQTAKLFDLPLVNTLIDRYLSAHLLNGAYKTTTINEEKVSKYDLVISNYAFSELPREVQHVYINKVCSQAKKGYITMNSGISGARSVGKLSIRELRNLLPDFDILEESPITGGHNYLIVWGHDKKSALSHFKIKE